MLPINTVSPSFEIQDHENNSRTEKDFIGTWTVLYFYPKDDTPGCTAQACSLRDSLPDLSQKGIQVWGASKDSVRSHQKFREKYHLPFTLLADTDHRLAELFDVWVEKKMYGRAYMGMQRSTYIINPEGKVVAAFPNVDPANHGNFLLEHLTLLIK